MPCKLKKQRPAPKPREYLPPKRIKLDVESGAESLAGIFQDNQCSIMKDPSDDIDSIVRDMKDYTVHNHCNVTSNEPMFSVLLKTLLFIKSASFCVKYLVTFHIKYSFVFGSSL